MKQKKNKISPVPAICSALGTIILVIIIGICLPLTLPKALGYEVYSVISGSMEPEIPVGSLVLVKGRDASEIKEKDVIAFYGGADSRAIITHRVVENRVLEGEFITKGDANKAEDMNPIPYENFIGKVELNIPELGGLAQFISTMQGKVTVGCLIGLAAVLHLLAGVLEKRR